MGARTTSIEPGSGSAGVEAGGRHQELVCHSPRQVAEAETGLANVTAHLTMVEDLGEGESQDANHGQDEQGLLITLVQRGLLEGTVGGDGLKDVVVDLPATAAQLRVKLRRNRAQVAGYWHRSWCCARSSFP